MDVQNGVPKSFVDSSSGGDFL